MMGEAHVAHISRLIPVCDALCNHTSVTIGLAYLLVVWALGLIVATSCHMGLQ